MSATNRARSIEPASATAMAEARKLAALVPPQPATNSRHVPALRVMPLQTDTRPRRFARVPTHAVGVHPEHREYPRATLKLPLRLHSVNHIHEDFPVTLVTRDISSTGVYFLCPR